MGHEHGTLQNATTVWQAAAKCLRPPTPPINSPDPTPVPNSCVLWHLFTAGFGGAECLECKAGTYSVGGSTAPCVMCGPGQTSQAGSPSAAFCQCPAGQGLVEGQTVCSVCPAGFYQPGPLALRQLPDTTTPRILEVGLSACRPCPLGRTSLPGTQSSDECGEWTTLATDTYTYLETRAAEALCNCGTVGAVYNMDRLNSGLTWCAVPTLCSVCTRDVWADVRPL